MKVNKEKIEAIVEKKWKNGCPLCNGREWSFNDKIISTPIQITEDRKYKFEGQIMPLVALICTNCGNTVFVNSLIAGALEEIDSAEEKE